MLHRFVWLYNQYLPLMTLNHQTPMQGLKRWQTSDLQLFQKEVRKIIQDSTFITLETRDHRPRCSDQLHEAERQGGRPSRRWGSTPRTPLEAQVRPSPASRRMRTHKALCVMRLPASPMPCTRTRAYHPSTKLLTTYRR